MSPFSQDAQELLNTLLTAADQSQNDYDSDSEEGEQAQSPAVLVAPASNTSAGGGRTIPGMMVVYNKVDLTSNDAANDHSDSATISNSESNSGSSGCNGIMLNHMLAGLSGSVDVPSYRISCTTGSGLQSLENALARLVERIISPDGAPDGVSSGVSSGVSPFLPSAAGSTMITRERHRRHVKLCVGHLDRFLLGTLPMDAAAEEIRYILLTIFVNKLQYN